MVLLKIIKKKFIYAKTVIWLYIGLCCGTPLARPPAGRHWIGRVSGAGVVAFVDLITLAFLKVSCMSFPNVHVAVRIYLSMAMSNCSGERLFQNKKE